MISLGLIIASAVLSAVAVAIAAWRVRWDVQAVATAAIGSAVTILLWRLLANAGGWNGDFMPLVSIGDTGCIIAGAFAPALVARRFPAGSHRWVPAAVGAFAGFVINVAIL